MAVRHPGHQRPESHGGGVRGEVAERGAALQHGALGAAQYLHLEAPQTLVRVSRVSPG